VAADEFSGDEGVSVDEMRRQASVAPSRGRKRTRSSHPWLRTPRSRGRKEAPPQLSLREGCGNASPWPTDWCPEAWELVLVVLVLVLVLLGIVHSVVAIGLTATETVYGAL